MRVDPQAGNAIASLVQQAEQLKAATRSGAADSAAKPEDLLFSALGAQLKLHEEDPTRTAVFSSNITAAFNDTLRDLGRRYFKLVEKALHDMLCGSEGEDVRKKIAEAGMNWGIIGTVLAGGIASLLGVAPAIASALAAIVIFLFIKPAGKLACETWHPA
jgi:hypothetical protein